MKYTMLLIALVVSIFGNTQSTKANDTQKEQEEIEKIRQSLPPCPKPQDGKLEALCTLIDKSDFKFVDLLEEMACVDRTVDKPLIIKAKVQQLWNAHYSEFYCNASGFSIENGNIAKYSVFMHFYPFIDYVVKHYGLTLNKKDAADGKTLLDYVQDEIRRFEGLSGQEQKVKELRSLYLHLKNELGARHAAEL